MPRTAEPVMTLVTGKPNNTAATRLGAAVGTKNEAAFVAIAMQVCHGFAPR